MVCAGPRVFGIGLNKLFEVVAGKSSTSVVFSVVFDEISVVFDVLFEGVVFDVLFG